MLEELGHTKKTVKAGPNSGYDPDLYIEIGFEMWATIRYYFFTMDNIDPDADAIEGMTLDISNYALYISEACSETLREAAMNRFGKMYVGCIH